MPKPAAPSPHPLVVKFIPTELLGRSRAVTAAAKFKPVIGTCPAANEAPELPELAI